MHSEGADDSELDEDNGQYYVRPIVDPGPDGDDKLVSVFKSNSIFDHPDTPLWFVLTPSLAVEVEDYAKPLLETSFRPASTPIALKGANASLRGDWEKPLKDKTGKLLDQPVTFHNRIKSSGYGQKPPDAFAKKRLEQAKSRARSNSVPRASGGTSSTKSSSAASAPKSGVKIRRYPITCNSMSELQAANNFPVDRNASSAPISNIEFSGDASSLGVATVDSAVLTLKLPVSRNNGDGKQCIIHPFFSNCLLAVSYMGHDGRINSVTFSHNKPQGQHMILSCSTDGTARLWKSGRIDSAAVIFSHTKQQPGDLLPNVGSLTVSAALSSTTAQMSTKTSRNRPYGDSITSAQFYYMDKFILLVSFPGFLLRIELLFVGRV